MLILRSAGELVLIAGLVFALGLGGRALAEWRHSRPVRPDRDGTTRLLITASDRRGSVSFEEGAGYVGWWHCTGDWSVDWRLKTPAGRYNLNAQWAGAGSEMGAKVQIVMDGQTLEAAAPNTGGWSKWKDQAVGQLTLPAGSHTLTIRPAAGGPPATLNLKSVTLKPAPD